MDMLAIRLDILAQMGHLPHVVMKLPRAYRMFMFATADAQMLRRELESKEMTKRGGIAVNGKQLAE